MGVAVAFNCDVPGGVSPAAHGGPGSPRALHGSGPARTLHVLEGLLVHAGQLDTGPEGSMPSLWLQEK